MVTVALLRLSWVLPKDQYPIKAERGKKPGAGYATYSGLAFDELSKAYMHE
jgi:hypothetical protein